jgi:hypothetical protein
VDRDPTDRPPRVLIEAVEWAVGEATAAAFRAAGWEADTCTGPVGLERRCPYLDGGPCAKLAWADVVVSRLGLWDVRNRELVERVARHSGLPVVAETPPRTFDRYRGELAGCVVVPYPARLVELVASAERSVVYSRLRAAPRP